MEDTLSQLGGLVVGSIPTIVLFLLLFLAYRSLVHAPLENVLSERRSKTEGALEKARADIAAAEAKTAEYELALRDARLKLFKWQEARRQSALDARMSIIAKARAAAEEQVREARATIETEVAESKIRLQGESERLASEVIQSIFRQVGAVQSPAGGAK
jgi:F-type H+-transporting ATPase subunit b